MERRVRTHPLVAVGTLAVLAPAECRGGLYNLKFWTKLGFRMTVGHTRHMDEGRVTHAWVAFGAYCIDIESKEIAMDLLCNFTGHPVCFRRLPAVTDPAPPPPPQTAARLATAVLRKEETAYWGLGRDIA